MIEILKNKSVAIVGNARKLFDQNYGEEIDSHEVVCRLNKGIIIEDSSKQGRKTDLWAYGDFSLVTTVFQDTHCKNTVHLSKNKRKQAGTRKRSMYFYPQERLSELEENLLWPSPSSGLILLDLVYNSSPTSITMYGFDWKETPTWCNTIEDNNLECVHNWDLEKRLIKEKYLCRDYVYLR
jgi:hypothetical protein